MNPPSPQPEDDDARLAAWMKQQTSTDALPDDGFSARVLAGLPPRRPVIAWRRAIICAGGALLGAVVARLDGGAWPSIAGMSDSLTRAAQAAVTLMPEPWMAAAFSIAVMIAIAAGAAALVLRDDESSDSPM